MQQSARPLLVGRVWICSSLMGHLQQGLDDASQLCLNRLVWGGLHVSVLYSLDAPKQQTLPEHVKALSLPTTSCNEAAAAASVGTTLGSPALAILVVLGPSSPAVWHSSLPHIAHLVFHVDSTAAATSQSAITSLLHLPQQLAQHQWRASPGTLLVAHAMAPKREKDMSLCCPPQGEAYTGGVLCLLPQQGLLFTPLDLGRDFNAQLPFQAVLHKASDQLQLLPSGRAAFGPPVLSLQAWLLDHHEVTVVDRLDCAAKVIDRVALSQHLSGLSQLDTGSPQLRLCAPRHCTLTSLDEADVQQQLQAAGLAGGPLILKPAVACGLPCSHAMALALGAKHVGQAMNQGGLQLPVVAQQFSNHGGTVAKVYVAGDKVFHSTRPSIPNIPLAWLGLGATWTRSANAQQAQPPRPQEPCSLQEQGFVIFNSLKSLPIQSWVPSLGPKHVPPHPSGKLQCAESQPNLSPDVGAVLANAPGVLQLVAQHLRGSLGLSLLGFDVIATWAQQDGPHPLAVGAVGMTIGEGKTAVEQGGNEFKQPGGGTSTQEPGIGENADRRGLCGQGRVGDAHGEPAVSGDIAARGACIELHVIDVNYLPSYKVPGAAVHVWAAIRAACEQGQAKGVGP